MLFPTDIIMLTDSMTYHVILYDIIDKPKQTFGPTQYDVVAKEIGFLGKKYIYLWINISFYLKSWY